jgi:hypothetical protein
MKLAIVSTTIQGEKGYLPFDVLAAKSKFSDVTFVIAGDTSSQPFDTSKFKCKIEHLAPSEQERFAISEVIGWKTPRRRPVAWLRAIELEPDYILTVDDDNIPPDDYFEKWYEIIASPKTDIAVAAGTAGRDLWHNYLRTSDAPIRIYPRGFPFPFRADDKTKIEKAAVPIAPEKIGVFQAVSLYDPDIDAVSKLIYEKPLRISSVGEKNYCLQNVWSPYNTQSTMLTKHLFPLPILWAGAGRMDDIYASFAWQKLLFNNGLYAHVGDPINNQDRGIRDIFNADFKLEIHGYLGAHEVWEQINTIDEKDGIAFLKKLIELPHPQIQNERRFFEAYLKDIQKILG